MAAFSKNKNLGYVLSANILVVISIHVGVFYTIEKVGLLLVIPEIIVIIIFWLICLKYAASGKPEKP